MEPDGPLKGIFHATDELDRRLATRYPPHADVRCTIRDPRSGIWLTAAIRDISTTGIALMAITPFETERLLTIELCHAPRGFACKLLVEVRHADICCPNDAWLLGCRFIHPLDNSELQLLL